MREDWKDDVFENARKYKMVNNDDGTVSLEDSTTYTQQGDSFGAKELNEIGKEINDLTNEMKETKKSVSDGKTLIAAAITLKRVATAATDTFAVMAEKIRQIVLGSGNATTGDVLKGKTFTNDDGVEYTGTLEDKSNTKQEVTASLDTTNKRVQMVAPTTGKYTNGTSVLYTTYAKLASLIGLTAAKLWPGITILGITSSKSSMAGGTYKPSTSQQKISCNGKAMTSDVVISACSLPAAANLKKGVKYTLPSGESVTGTFEGYADKGTLILYDYETYWSGSTSKTGMSVPSGMDYLQSGNSGGSITFKNVPLAGYQTLHVTYDPSYKDVNGFSTDYFKARLSASDRVSVSITPTATGSVTKTLDVSGCNDNYDIYLDFNNGYTNLFKVWLD